LPRRHTRPTRCPKTRLAGGKKVSTAREIMHFGVECIGENETLAVAAQKMRDLHVGSMPICGEDDRLHGIITDRDIVVRCIAEGRDPQSTSARDLAFGTPIWVDVDADSGEVLRLMEDNKIRRLPVMDGQRLVGMISEADLAGHMGERELSEFVSVVYTAPPTN
jgi:CBS domain-containing protein